MKGLLLSFGICLFLLSSCTISQRFSFNEDLSGTYILELDMSMMMSLMGGEESEDSDSTEEEVSPEEEEMSDLVERLKATDGISDVKYNNEEKGKFTISYRFRDIDVLNSSLSNGELTREMSGSHVFFEQKGSKLTYTIPDLNDNDGDTAPDLEGMDDMMLEMMKYELEFYFAGGVKKAKSKQLKKTLRSTENLVIWESNIKELMKRDGATVISIKTN